MLTILMREAVGSSCFQPDPERLQKITDRPSDEEPSWVGFHHKWIDKMDKLGINLDFDERNEIGEPIDYVDCPMCSGWPSGSGIILDTGRDKAQYILCKKCKGRCDLCGAEVKCSTCGETRCQKPDHKLEFPGHNNCPSYGVIWNGNMKISNPHRRKRKIMRPIRRDPGQRPQTRATAYGNQGWQDQRPQTRAPAYENQGWQGQRPQTRAPAYENQRGQGQRPQTRAPAAFRLRH